MALTFEWDEGKARRNLQKHGLSFEEAVTAFGDPRSLTTPDPDHSASEERFILLGKSQQGRIVVVVHVERGENLRIISARPASRKERTQYAEG